MKAVWIIGSGGHAKVVIDTLKSGGEAEVIGLLDDDPCREGASVLGVRVLGQPSREAIERLGIEHAIIAVGGNRARARLAAEFEELLSWVTAVHPASYVARDASLGEGTLVCAGSVVQPGARVGRHVILNTGCRVDHDGSVGDFAHIAPGASLAGNVAVGDGALVGIGASVIPALSIGAWSSVGAGAVVVANIPDGQTALGVPAKVRPSPVEGGRDPL